MTFSSLKKNLKKDYSSFKKHKIAILADSSSQLLVQALRGYGYTKELELDIYDADYDQIEGQVFNSASELYSFRPDYIVIFQSVNKLLKKFQATPISEKGHFAQKQIHYVDSLVQTINSTVSSKIIYLNFPELDDCVFGNFANKIDHSWLFQLRNINVELMTLAQNRLNFYISDLSIIQNQFGRNVTFDSKAYVSADMILSIEALPYVAKNIADIVLSLSGRFNKCLIIDLDNTMWGGIIGDDGIENIQIGDLGVGKAFTELQKWMLQLKERGIILTICSKNTEHIAKEPFEKHPDMVLKLNDIALFVANWDSKVDNIKYIQTVLNIGLDSMVFIDDNPFERNVVRTHLPELTVPELPEDPADYLLYLRSLNLFEANSFSEEDTKRTVLYQEESDRTILQRSFTSEEDFLQSLDMLAIVKSFDEFSSPRVAQLSQRSNQFNLRTVRYTEDEIKKISTSTMHKTITFNLKDKFGDYGLISAIILESREENLFVDTWIMSCRVLKRGMESFVLNKIVAIAKENGSKKVIGEYIPTPKNGIVKDHFNDLGFTKVGEAWELDIQEYEIKKNHIQTQ